MALIRLILMLKSSGGRQLSKTRELLLCLRRKRGRVGVQVACIPFFVWVVYLKSIFVLAGRNYFRSFTKQANGFFQLLN